VSGLRYDSAASARLERTYTTADIQAQRDEVRRSLAARRGESILDLGSGPGILACELALEVGPSGRVVAVDVSAEMNAIASRRIDAAGLGDRVEVVEGDAVGLDFADASFDAAVSTQVIEYVDDVDAALRELRRVLRPGARLLLLDTDWDTLIWPAYDQARAARIADAWRAHAPHPTLPPRLAPRLRAHGFGIDEVRTIPLLNTSYAEGTYGYNLAALIAEFLRQRGTVPDHEIDDWLADLATLDRNGAYFLSLNRYLFQARAA
jgi:ubiquinone/menaquinone biosynthesis C-methylase UbiE